MATAAVFAISGNYGGEDYNYNLYAEITIYRGQHIADKLPPEPELRGLRFAHWSLTPYGEAFDFGQQILDETTFYAIWHDYDGYTHYAYDEYGYDYAPRYVGDYAYDDGHSYDEAITVTFLWNRGEIQSYAYDQHINHTPSAGDYTYYDDYHAYDEDVNHAPVMPNDDYYYHYNEAPANYEPHTDGYIYACEHGNIGDFEYINIYIDDRANVTVYPDVIYGVILDGDYVHVRFPAELYFGDIGVSLPEIWSYEITHLVEISEEYVEYYREGSFVNIAPVEIERTYTMVTISHDILSRAAESRGNIGFVPFGINEPPGFQPPVILAPPFDNAAWTTAIGTNTAGNNRVVVIPHDVELPAELALTANRHVIIVSLGTDLNGSLTNHTAPPNIFTVTHTGASLRHFTVANTTTLTLSHVVLDGGVAPPAISPLRGGIHVAAGGHFNMLAGSVLQHNRINGGGGLSAAGTTGTLTMSGNSRITANSSGTAAGAAGVGGGVNIAGGRLLTMSDTSSISGNYASNGAGVNIAAANARLYMNDSSRIYGNTATTNGGGVALSTNGSIIRMYDTSRIHGNFANGTGASQGGGGVAIISGTAAIPSVFTMSNGSIYGNTAHNGGGVLLAAAGARFTMNGGTIGGTTSAHANTANINGGGVNLATNGARLYMNDTSSIHGNTANGTGASQGGGGVAITSGTAGVPSVFTMSNGSIFGNTANNGGGVLLATAGARFTMEAGTIGGLAPGQANTANINGGGVALLGNGARFYMEAGSILGNFANGTLATNGGGGVHVGGGATSAFIMTTGSITNNHAISNGGGIYATSFSHFPFLPNNAYPQLDIAAAAVFNNNTAGEGSSNPPSNALTATAILTTQASGTFSHPLNNLDINFFSDDGDWLLLNGVITNGADITNIVIHPAGTPGVTTGVVGSTFNLVISSGNGSTITTVPIPGAPAADPHRINVTNNTIIVEARPGSNIVLDMTALTAPNGTVNLGRHFLVGAGGNLTLGGGAGSGNLILDGNIGLAATGTRGGINVNNATGVLTLAQGATITSGRAASGAVQLSANGASFNMTGGSIASNTATTSGGGVAITAGTATVLSQFTMSGGTISGNTAPSGGGVVLAAAGARFIMENGTIGGTVPGTANTATTTNGGGVALTSNGARMYMEDGSIIGNVANGTGTTNGGGGVAVASGTAAIPSYFTMEGGNISGNTAANGGGVLLAAAGARFIMENGTLGGTVAGQGNTANISGGGVALVTNGATFYMEAGTITGNFANGTAATNGGGGVFIATGALSHFTFEGGLISNNRAVTSGGGVFTTAFSSGRYLPTTAFPQLTVYAAAAFTGNTAGHGSTTPPLNGTDAGIAVTTQITGNLSHPLNNLDINFPASINADWALLNSIIYGTTVDTIVIHPTGTTGVPPGINGAVYNLIISDPCPYNEGRTITTVALLAALNTHNIIVARPVTIQAAPGANIVLRMPVAGAPNTPDTAPWLTTQTTLPRHFTINAGGVLTLGGGTGTLTLDGNAHLIAQNRGGVTVMGNAGLVLQTGGVIYNNRLATGGGVQLSGANATFNMTGGSITNNIATTSGGGVALTVNNSIFTMSGGDISSNNANGTAVGNGGGGVHIAAGADSHFTFSGGTIQNNHANASGGGIFTMAFTYTNPLPIGAYPQLTVEAAAVFTGNTANAGSFNPPSNSTAATAIQATADISGGYDHPLNNLDINFVSQDADWFRLHSIINATNIETIIIHPTSSGATPGASGTTYNFIISDPGDGHTITTTHLEGGTSPHNITVSRAVAIQAATDMNIVIRMPLPGAPNTPDVAPWLTNQAALSRHFVINTGGELTLGGGAGAGNLTLDGNADLNTSIRGGVLVNASAGLVLQTRAAITNSRAASGGGVQLAGNNATLNMTGGSISNNYSNGATATAGGGGVALTLNGAQFTMSGGNISGNTSHANGGGVHMIVGVAISFEFSGGNIQNNHAGADGGGIFTSTFTYGSPLPTGAHFPQLNISVPAAFSGNTAGNGNFPPPTNAAVYTQIANVPSSGVFTHPLNNYDINFLPGDWNRLNVLVSNTAPNPQYIVIHATGAPGVTPGMAVDGITYNFVVTDPGNGSTITTVPIQVGAAAAEPHRINVLRPVTIKAAPGTNIVFAMTANSINTGAANIGRHFHVGGNGNLTLGGGTSWGNLTLDGNADTRLGNRGGVTVNVGTGRLNLVAGGVIYNCRAATGGGVALTAGGAQFAITGGSVITNISTGNGGGVALSANNTHLTMTGGSISGNIAATTGGGVHIAAGADSLFTLNSGTIQNNHAASNGGGIFASIFTYANPLPHLPTGVHFPQLRVYAPAIFTDNTAGYGGSPHPPNVTTYTYIETTAQSSGGFTHPLNNLDINFFFPAADWFRLHRLVTTTTVENIVIHQANAPGITPGLDGLGTTYNFVITDPHPNPLYVGRTITTAHLQGGTTNHRIDVNRTVTIAAADEADILILMPVPGSPNTPNTTPWLTTLTNLAVGTAHENGRHFQVSGGGQLTLRGIGSGTLTLDGNASLVTMADRRGGIAVASNGLFVLEAGAVITNSHGRIGGGVGIANHGEFIMTGGTISGNAAITGTDGWGAGGGGVAFTSTEAFAVFTMKGGTISDNVAAHGGGVWAMGGTFTMYDGLIVNNTAGIGTGSHVVSNGNNRHGAGGGVMICCSGDFIMHRGIIDNNVSRVGGGVFMSHRRNSNDPAFPPATFTMRGGYITNNHATVTHLDPNDIDVPDGSGALLLGPGIGLRFDEDGGGIFITESGEFIMADPVVPNAPYINISSNTADNHGGGIYWEVGLWETDDRTQPVIISDNTALEDGGGIFTAYGTLDMFGYWEITHNSANRGGGIFLSGNATPYGNTGTWHPDLGPAHLVMHDGLIYDNWSYTSGGGVYVYRDGAFYMLDGAIDYNKSAVFGGGVYVFNPGIHYTARFHVYGGEITRNSAIYGGGVYLMYRAHMSATDTLFAHNTAQRMGGAIFTELVDYGYMLTGEPVPHDILFPTPPDPNEIFHAFTNIVTSDTVRFRGNTAASVFHSPYNAYTLTDIQWELYDVPGSEHVHLSVLMHPFNNFDINYVRPIYFYKTDMAIYETPRAINNLPGAVFTLDIWEYYAGDGVYDWRQYTTSAGVPVTATSEANGRVALFVFTPGEFRLREVTPPTGNFVLPPGHWYFDMDVTTIDDSLGVPSPLLFMITPPPQPSPANSDFTFVWLDRVTGGTIDEPGSQAARMRWHVGNAPPSANLYLHKTNYDLFDMTPTLTSQIEDILLPGAVFALYRYTGTGTPANTLVPAAGWVRTLVRTSIDDPDYPMMFRMGFREDQSFSYYQLVELVPPVGFTAPFGQWRVRMDVVDVATNTVTMAISTQGSTSTPELVPLTGEDGWIFAVGNRWDFELPLTGGLGSMGMMPMIATGSVAVLAGLGVMGYLVVSKELKQKKALFKNTSGR